MKFSWKTAFLPLHWLTALSVFAADQVSKYYVVKIIPMGTHVPIFSFFDLVHTKNSGAAFGLFHDSSPLFRLVLFGIVTLVCLYLIFYWLGTTPIHERMQRLGLSLILGGAFGNLLDRTLYGEVTDFVHFFYGEHHFPAFNVADSGITVGVAFLLLRIVHKEKGQSR